MKKSNLKFKNFQCDGQLDIFSIEVEPPKQRAQLQNKSINVEQSDEDLYQCVCGHKARIVKSGVGCYITCSYCGKSTPMGYNEEMVKAEWSHMAKAKPQWHRLERSKPPEDSYVKVMYSWSLYRQGDRTGECAAQYRAGKFYFIQLPWDIGRVVPEAWRYLTAWECSFYNIGEGGKRNEAE